MTMADFTDIIWLNGELVAHDKPVVSIASPSLHYGIGIFDGIMAYRNKDHYYIHYGHEHISRMLSSCEHFGLRVKWTVNDLHTAIYDLLKDVRPSDYYIRPLVYRDKAQLTLTGPADNSAADVAIMAMAVPRDVETPITCHLSAYERVSSKAIPVGWKICAAYTNSYLVRRAAEEANFDDGIMLSRDGLICEASAANVFFIKKDALVTPAITPEIFPGITREIVIDMARASGMEVIERNILAQEVGSFDGVFLTATLMEIKPVKAIGHYHYDSPGNPLLRKLLGMFREITHK